MPLRVRVEPDKKIVVQQPNLKMGVGAVNNQKISNRNNYNKNNNYDEEKSSKCCFCC